MSSETLTPDGNTRNIAGAVTDDSNAFIKKLRIDDATKGLKVMLVGGTGSGTVTSISQGTGIVATPNPIIGTGTIALANTAVTPGAYTNANITVDQQGRITLAANGSGSSGITINTTTITGGTTGQLLYDNAATVGELTTATYPSLTELSYVKGLTSSAQTQLTAAATKTGSNWTFASQAIGDLPYASSTTAYTRLAAVATGSVLISEGTGTAPAWSTTPAVANMIEGFRIQATAAGTTTLVVGDAYQQYFTGSTTQTVALPTTGIVAGQAYQIVNQSTGIVTVQSSGANTILAVPANTTATFTALVSTPTTAANWAVSSYSNTPSTSANALNSATTIVNVSSATAPTAGQVLTATSGTAATWQAAGGSTSVNTITPFPNFETSSYFSPTISSNTTGHVGQISIPYKITANQISFYALGITTPGTFIISMYSQTGTQIFSVTTASISSSNTVVSTSLSSVVINPGTYYILLQTVGTASIQVNFYGSIDIHLQGSVTGKPVLEGTYTVTNGVAPASLTLSSIVSTQNETIAFRLDN